MEVLNGNEESSIKKAVGLLKAGDIVAFPTETVYGLGADAFNPLAVVKIFEVKRRPRFDPLIVHIGNQGWLEMLAESLDPLVDRLTQLFWPGPLTIIVRKKPVIPDVVTAGLPTVGIRMPSHTVALSMIREFGQPVAAPSANPFGYLSPTMADHVSRSFRESVPLVLDGGKSDFGIESTIVSVRNGEILVHRHGAVSVEDLSHVTNHIQIKKHSSKETVYESPGELPYHYAPHKPLVIIDSLEQVSNHRSAVLAFRKPSRKPRTQHMHILSEKGDLREAATNFFSSLIELDSDDIDIIYAEKIPNVGIGKAMMERLEKASKKHGDTKH